jgi:hypothetical protein
MSFSRELPTLLGIAVAALLTQTAIARADQACEEQCDREWWCAKNSDGDGCNWARRQAHPAGHKACLAKCWAKDKAGAAVETVKQGYEAVKEKAVETYEAAKDTAKKAVDTVKKGAKATKDWAADKYQKGKEYVQDKVGKVKAKVDALKEKGKQTLKDIKDKGEQIIKSAKEKLADFWSLLKTLDCGKIVEAAANLDPLQMVLNKVPGLGACRVELNKGFWCKIPNLVKDIATLLKGALTGAWENKKLCGAVAAATMGTGLIGCGIAMWMGPKLAKVASCFNALRKSTGIINALKTIFSSGGAKKDEPKWLGMLKFGCNFVGGILFDVVLAVLTGGGSIAGTISAQIVKMLPSLAGKTSQWILQKAVGAGIAGTQQLIRVVDRALPGACR